MGPREVALRVVLYFAAVVLVTYFTASHWFFHRFFFHALGIDGPELDSPFVMSQLQIIGALALGYALLCVAIARHPVALREVLKIGLGTTGMVVMIFVANVATGRLPAAFLVNALLLTVFLVAVAVLFPRRE